VVVWIFNELTLIVLGLITASNFMFYDIYKNNFQKTNHVSE